MSQIHNLHVGSEDVMKQLAREYKAENWTSFGETCDKIGEDGAITLSVPKLVEGHVQRHVELNTDSNVANRFSIR